MKKIKRIMICFISVLLLNALLLFSYSFFTEKENNNAVEKGKFFDVLVNDNPITKTNDYDVSNWDSQTSSKEKKQIFSILENADCKKTGKLVACSVQLLQNSRNSICEIELFEINGESKENTNSISEWFSKTHNSAVSCEIVKLFEDYYLVCDYIDDVEDIDNFFLTSVYKVVNSEEICNIDDFQKSNEYYSRTYPDKISFFASSPLWIVLFVATLLCEVLLVYNITGKRDRTGDGSKPLKKCD